MFMVFGCATTGRPREGRPVEAHGFRQLRSALGAGSLAMPVSAGAGDVAGALIVSWAGAIGAGATSVLGVVAGAAGVVVVCAKAKPTLPTMAAAATSEVRVLDAFILDLLEVRALGVGRSSGE
jgi:hypothetical protein